MTNNELTASHVPVLLGNRPVGQGHNCFIIAEAGVNHNGNADMAHRLVDLAADAGADAVKFQTFDPELVVATDAQAAPYQRAAGHARQDEMLRALTLPDTAWRELAAHAAEREIAFLSTAFDASSLDVVLDLGVVALKVPSGELDNLAFIARLARCGLPLIISTGMGDLEEVDAAVRAAAGAPGLCILHCVTAYPTPVEASNLRALCTLDRRFRVPVGWSDHTGGSVTAVAAIALGAAMLEKHFTLDRSLPGPDHAASEDPDSFRAYVRDVRAAESALGDGVKRPADVERANRLHARRSYHARVPLRAGQTIGTDDVLLLRPARGLAPSADVVGRICARDIAQGEPLYAGDVH
jgi:N,N'-diacetyllegionaminate synthase